MLPGAMFSIKGEFVIMRQNIDYDFMLEEIMAMWLGPEFKQNSSISAPYRMLAVLLEDPWTVEKNPRPLIVDYRNPDIRRKLDMLYNNFHTVMKVIELRWANASSDNDRTEGSSSPLV